NQNNDSFQRNAGARQSLNHRSQKKPVWDWTSDVTNRDRSASHVAGKLGKRRAFDWLGEGLTHGIVRIMQNRHCRFAKDVNIQFLPKFNWQDASAVVQVAMHNALLVCPRVTIDFPATSYAFGRSRDSGKTDGRPVPRRRARRW